LAWADAVSDAIFTKNFEIRIAIAEKVWTCPRG